MGGQWGMWSFDGQPIASACVEQADAALAPYGPDGNQRYSKDGTTILYRAFHTTMQSHREVQPHVSSCGNVITWDGRLDNRAGLVAQLRDHVTTDSTDVAIVAAAYEEWGETCFAKLIGDWSLSIWKPAMRSLLLVNDPVGTRHLYYSIEKDHVNWCTILDPLVLFARRTFAISDEYVAGWLSHFPAARLTPYSQILAVAPSSLVFLQLCNHGPRHVVSQYWNFDPGKTVRYHRDSEYEEEFRALFATAVQRRLRSDRPVLAELSGGMDSSAIVCMADTLIAKGKAECPRLDTISWFDDTHDQIEPDTNELHWITRVEERRGTAGHHLNCRDIRAKEASAPSQCTADSETNPFLTIPDSGARNSEFVRQYAACLGSEEHRVTLSGIGGSEFLGGGVPTPVLELQDLLSRAHFLRLSRQLTRWAEKMQESRPSILWETIQNFFPARILDLSKDTRPVSWLHSGFIRRNHSALNGYAVRIKLLGPLPSFQSNLSTLDSLHRLLAYWRLRSDLLREVRLPYLDRDLLEFLFAIPREQVVAVGRRRSLMRRALSGLVPEEVLNRRRKAFVHRKSPKDHCAAVACGLREEQILISDTIGIVDTSRLEAALRGLGRGEEVSMDALQKTLSLEFWLRDLARRALLRTNAFSTRSIAARVMPADWQESSSSLPRAK
jgi:asparagine synthase (glutamine-hydrolysing)